MFLVLRILTCPVAVLMGIWTADSLDHGDFADAAMPGLVTLLCSIPGFPELWIRLFQRLGWYELVYNFARFLPPWWGVDEPRGAAELVAVRAYNTRKRPEARDWLRRVLAHYPSKGPLSVQAKAAFCRLEGEWSEAHLLYRSLDAWTGAAMEGGPVGRARRIARRYLMAEAAETGNWAEVLRLGLRRRPAVREAELFAGAVARVLGHPWALSPFRLYLRWVFAGRYRLWWEWLQRPVIALPAPVPEGPLLETTLQFHRRSARKALISREELVELGNRWEKLRNEGELEGTVGGRIAALEARVSPESVKTRFLEEARGEIRGLLGRCAESLEDLPPMVQEAVEEEWRERTLALERRCQRLYQNRAVERSDQAHWVEWGGVLEDWESVRRLGNLDQRRGLFLQIWSDLNNYAACLANERDSKMLANQIFRTLFAKAVEVGGVPEKDLQLLMRNVRARTK